MPADRAAHRHLLAAYLRPERARLVAAGLVLVVGQTAPLAGPILLRRFVDEAVGGASRHALSLTALLYLVATITAQALAVAVTWAGASLAWRVTDRIRADLCAHTLGLDLSWHAQHTAGELIERVDGDVTAISDYFSRVVLQVLAAGVLLVGVLVLAFAQDWRAGAALAIFTAGAVAVMGRLRDHAVPSSAADRAATAELYGMIEERLAGIEDVRANAGGAHVIRRFHERSAASYRARIRAEHDGATVLTITHFTNAVGMTVALATGIWLYSIGAVTLGTVFLLYQCMQLLRRPFELIAEQLRALQKAGAGAARVAAVLAEEPLVVEGPGAPLPIGALGVAFDGVTFAYEPGRGDALRNVSFAVPAGHVLGVVGATGSGKTTIARLLLRLYDVSSGGVTVGGVDVRTLRRAQLHTAVGVVTQDVQLFAATLRDNLTLFGDGVVDAHLADVLHSLELGDWLDRLPAGLDTELGPDGSGLSAGEAQLLAFARVFLHDPGVVILDEASSRLDPATEQRIERAVDRLLVGRTAIVIAHRLATLERADDILVLEHGAVVEHGSRAALTAGGLTRFARLLDTAEGSLR